MKTERLISSLILLFLLTAALTVSAAADSSWVWISETRPYDVLPWAAILTIGIETLAIDRIPKVDRLRRTVCFVALANLLSFAAPYAVNFLVYRSEKFEFSKYLEHWPSYLVGLSYGLATIAIEVPVLYLALRKHTARKKTLLLTIVCSNVATTCVVAVLERVFCRGNW